MEIVGLAQGHRRLRQPARVRDPRKLPGGDGQQVLQVEVVEGILTADVLDADYDTVTRLNIDEWYFMRVSTRGTAKVYSVFVEVH